MAHAPAPARGEVGLTLIGRSSSSFTRITRMVAAELCVPHAFRVVPSLLSLEAADYGGNPALKLPALETAGGTWFGSANICRVLAKHAKNGLRVVWPEALDQPITANAQELTLAALSTEVALVMSHLGAAPGEANATEPYALKMRRSLLDTLGWLDANLEPALAALPADRDFSYLELSLFCLVTHIEFRNLLPITTFSVLGAFCQRFGERPSAALTAYRFDL